MADEPRDDVARSAGRGVVFIGGAKIYFMIAGFAIETGLARILGNVLYGGYGFVAQAVSTVNNVVVTGTIQAVSRATTADATAVQRAKATGLRMHLMVGLPLAILFGALAPLWAHLAHDPSKAGPMALSAAIVAGYAFYAVLVGSANGARQFHKQAGLDVMFATMRAIAVLGGAAAGLGLFGPIAGWVAAVVLIFLIASLWVGLPRFGAEGQAAGPVMPMIRFLGGVATYLILVNFIMSMDSFLLKRLSAEWAYSNGHVGTAAAEIADGRVGYYRAVQQLARLPYQLMIAVTFVIFPLVSQATFDKDQNRARDYVRTTLRYSLILATLMGVTLAANPSALLDVPFAADFALEGGPALAALALGHVAFAVFTIAGTILNSAGHTKDTVVIAAGTLAVLVVALWVAIPRFDATEDVLLASALATGGAMTLGAVASGVMLLRRMGAFLPVLTAVRVLAAAVAAMLVGRVIPAPITHGVLPTMAEAVAVAGTFLVVLVASRELSGRDLRALGRVASRRK